VLANLLDHGKLELLVDRVARNVNQPIGPLGALSLANAPTLFDALGSLARLSNIHRKYFDASVVFQGETAIFLLERRLPATRLADVIALLTLLVAERLVSSYANETDCGIEVSCSFVEDPPIPIPPALPGIEYRLGADRNTVRFPSSWLDRETGLSDARLWRIAQELVASAEAQEADHPILADVRKRTAQILAERRRVPRLKEMVADGNSARTFARILASQGTSYRAVVESERRKQALKLINDPSLALDEIAEALGFPDKSSFGRSFRRWFGQTPGQFRSARK
jgi:AraC-like DNA-binding protein